MVVSLAVDRRTVAGVHGRRQAADQAGFCSPTRAQRTCSNSRLFNKTAELAVPTVDGRTNREHYITEEVGAS